MIRSWLDYRSILLAALLAVAAALPSMTTNVEQRDYYFFDITLTSSSPGWTQFFWDQGAGFTEYDSSRQPLKIEREPVVYRFMMPMGRFKALRFDPVDGIGDFTFSDARIMDRWGRLIHAFAPEDLQPAGGIIRVTPRGQALEVITDPASHDPIINLRLAQPLILKSNPRIWWEHGWPVALPVFLAGLFLGLPLIARRLDQGAKFLAVRARRHPVITISLAAAVAVAIQCHPVVFLGRSFASPNNGAHMYYDGLPALPGETDAMSTNTGSSDTGAFLFQHVYYPMVQRDALRHGEWPLWNRYSLSGEPLLGQGQSMFGDPFNFITILADGAAWAWDLRFLIARWILTAALGGIVWQLTRRLGAAVLTTLAAAFLGFFTYRLVHPANFSVCYSPLILLAWTGLITAVSPRQQAAWLAALIGANWIVMTSGTVKEAYMLMVCLNFAGVVLLLAQAETKGRRMRLLGLTTLAGAGFILLAAPIWLTFLNAWGHAMTGYDSPQAQTLPWRQIIGFFDDIFYRQTQADERVVAPALNFLFLLGVLWWFVQPREWRLAPAGWALILAAVPPFALAFGIVPEAVIVKIPFVGNIVHVGNTFSCVLLILGAVLGGLGFSDAWDRLREPAAWRVIARVALVALALAGLYFFDTKQFTKTPFFTGYAPAIGLAALLLLLGLYWGARSNRPSGAIWVALALALPIIGWRHCQYGTFFFERYTFAPGPRANLHAPSPAAAMLNAAKHAPGRVVGWGSSLYASYNTVLRWEGLYGVDAVRSAHYQDLAVSLGLRRIWDWDWPNKETDSLALIRKHDIYNTTHYVASHVDGPHPIAGLTTIGQADLDVYVSPTAWPRAFFCDGLTRYHKPDDFASLVMTGDGRPFAAVQAGDPLAPPAKPTVAPERLITPARDYHFTPNRTTFTLDAPSAGVAVLTETYFLDDFEVTLNGQSVPYFRVNHAFKGVVIPTSGTYTLTFNYWPRFFTLSLWLAAVGAVVLITAVIWLWRLPAYPYAKTSCT